MCNMRIFQIEYVLLLWCCTFNCKTAMELDLRTQGFATYGWWSPKNLKLYKGEPITVPWAGKMEFPPTTDLQMDYCDGTIDGTTFSNMPELRNIFIGNSKIDKVSSDSFATLKKLETLEFGSSNVTVDKASAPATVETSPLPDFKVFVLHLSTVSGLKRDLLSDLGSLDTLKIDNCEILDAESEALADLKHISHLEILSSKMSDFDFSQILKLSTLKYLALHDLETNSKIDYNSFKSLPNLDTILFDTLAYRDLDFEAFPRLRSVEVGLGDTKEAEQLKDKPLFDEIMDRIDSMKAKGIQKKTVRAGKHRIYPLASGFEADHRAF